MGPLGESLLAWVWLPVLALIVCVGVGLLVCRLLRHDLHGGLVAPVGLCGAIVLVMPAYRLGAGSAVALALLGIASAAGFVLSRHGLRHRLDPGWALAAGALAFCLYLAPVVLAGGWTWPGYNFVNDTATQLLLADHIGEHGIEKPIEQLSTEAELEGTPTSVATIYFYLRAAYPVGAHALLASVAPVAGAPLPALYAPFIAFLVALAAMAISVLASAFVDRRLAALVALAAVAANLTYAYALQGNIKEMALLACAAAAAAVAGELPRTSRLVPPAVIFALCLGAMFSVFGAAGAPFAGATAAAAVVGVLAVGRHGRLRHVAAPLAAGVATVAGIALVSATGLLLSLEALVETFGTNTTPEDEVGDVAAVSELGHLLRPLPLEQIAGVWLNMDYRTPVPPSRSTLNAVLIALVLGLFAIGAVWLVRRRAIGALVLIATAVATVALVGPRVSPYAAGKLLALGSPAIVVGAAAGAAAIASWRRPIGIGLATVAAVGLFLSDAYTYHGVKLAPSERIQALEDVGEHYARPVAGLQSRDPRGRVLLAENEEFGKYLLRDAFDVDAFDSISPVQVQLKAPQSPVGRHFDLDEQILSFVDSFDWIVQRRGPTASRPPANFTPDFGNRYYQAWRRTSQPQVLEHLGLQGADQPSAVPRCAEIRALAARAETGEVLVAAPRPLLVKLDTATARRSPGWVPHPYVPDSVITTTPGEAQGRERFSGGRYRVWIRGSFGRAIHAHVDGRPLGAARGVETPGQWHDLGRTVVGPGVHEVGLRRDGGDLRPGDGFAGELGPLAFEPLASNRLVRVAPGDWRELCGQPLDWVERVSP